MEVNACPMGNEWRDWDLSTKDRFTPSNPDDVARVANARAAKLGKVLRQISTEWLPADDDASVLPPPEGSHFLEGSPSHLHTDFVVEGEHVHIDRLYANKFAPGRSFLEYRIFVNGKLAGRGGFAGSSLGGTGNSDLPAAALIGPNKVIAVDGQMVITLMSRDYPLPGTK